MKVTLDNSRIASMAAGGNFVAAFPFLSMATEKRACCGRVTGRTPDYEGIRKVIAGLPDDQKAKLKQLLQAEEVTVHYHDGTGIKAVVF